MKKQIYLSPPHLAGTEKALVGDALDSGWITPLGPHVDAFEAEFAEVVGAAGAAAVASGTAALHLALRLAGVEAGDDVLVSTLTFVASVNPIVYLGARPVFIDSERMSWNMDAGLLRETLARRAAAGRLPRAVVLVHIYGQTADLDAISAACREYGVALIEDAAEALGSSYRGAAPGTRGEFGIFSFNGNKIITCGGGGMLVSQDEAALDRARRLASQAREPFPWYEHTELGYNYRLSNILAAVGRAQLPTLEERVRRRREIFAAYTAALDGVSGIGFMPEASWGHHARWLSVVTIDADEAGVSRDSVMHALQAENIESRPVWKPMHLQPVFGGCEAVAGDVARDLFEHGLCLPSGSGMSDAELDRVVAALTAALGAGRMHPR